MDPELLPPANPTVALEVRDQIESLLSKITAHELRLSSLWVQLGQKLSTVERDRLWIDWGYGKFSQYLAYVQQKVGRGRSQLYAILGVSQALLPVIPKEKLEEIGITKAYELKRLVAEGRRPDIEILDPDNQEWDAVGTVSLIDFAARPKVTKERLHAVVSEILHVKSEPKGTWLDVGGFYVLPDERKEIEGFWETGARLLQMPADKPEHEVRKEVFLAAVREAMGTWQAEVNGGGY